MNIPMVLLAVAAAAGGLIGLTAVDGILQTFLAPAVGEVAHGEEGLSELALGVISVAVALAGIGVGWLVYGSGRVDWAALRSRLPGLHRTLERGWYVDDAYGALLVAPGKAGSSFMASVVDQRVIDGGVNGLGRVVAALAASGRRVQTGLVRNYALAFLLGAVGILLFVALRY